MQIRVLNEGYSSQGESFYCIKAEGCYIYNNHNKQFIDMAMGGGTAILGHSHPAIQSELKQQLALGSLFTAPTPYAYEFAELLNRLTPQQKDFVFCSTGSEATMRAIRLAKAYNGKNKIAVFSGCWHGSHDFLLLEEDYRFPIESPQAVLKSAGSPHELLDHVVLLPYNHQAAFNIIKERADEISMAFVEPMQGSNPRDDVTLFLKELRTVCTDNDILLGFDEVITGARLGLGGGQEYFDITADIVTYGKTLGGGLPIGILSGKQEVMNTIRSNKPLFMGGTFSANPLSLIAGITTIKQLINTTNLYQSINEQSSRLRDSINQFCKKHSINAHMMGGASLSRLVFCKDTVKSRRERDEKEIEWKKQADFYQILKQHGVYIGGNRINFMSYKHSAKTVDKVIDAYQQSLMSWHIQGVI